MLSDTKSDCSRKINRQLFSNDLSNDIDFLIEQQFQLDRQRMITLWSFDIETCEYLDDQKDKPSSSSPTTLSSSPSKKVSKKRPLSNKENQHQNEPKKQRKKLKNKLN